MDSDFQDVDDSEIELEEDSMDIYPVIDDGINVYFPFGIFHKSFENTYKGYTVINTRRKLKRSYTRSQQNLIIKYLKRNNILN